MRTQYAALAYQIKKGEVSYLLVSSRRTGRWVFPKGSARPGERHWRTAEREALEEAGVSGEISRKMIGTYHTLRIRDLDEEMVKVHLYPLRIDKIRNTWQEQGLRKRIFLNAKNTRTQIAQPDMAALVKQFHRRLVEKMTA